MSRAAQLMIGVSLVTVPTIIYGGLTLLGIVSRGAYGAPAPHDLTLEQKAYYRAGHAHAGVLLILSMVLQMVIDDAQLGVLSWPARIAAAAATLLVSGGFFAVAHVRATRFVLYAGAVTLALTTLVVGIGLLCA